MSDERQLELDAQQKAAQDALRELDRPVADRQFRDRLRSQFVAGDLPASRSVRRAPLRAILPLAAALAAVFAVVLLNRGPRWEVSDSSGVRHVLVDGASVPLSDLPLRLSPGARIALPAAGTLDLSAAGLFMLQLDGQVEVVLPQTPGRWFGRDVSGEVAGDGRLRVVTGPHFAGSKLALRSGVAEWLVTGTAFTAIVHDGFMCLCVLEGTVLACPPGGTMEPIPAGQRATFSRDAPEVDRGPMRDDERTALAAIVQRLPQSNDNP